MADAWSDDVLQGDCLFCRIIKGNFDYDVESLRHELLLAYSRILNLTFDACASDHLTPFANRRDSFNKNL